VEDVEKMLRKIVNRTKNMHQIEELLEKMTYVQKINFLGN
jgi:hypothetical protein